MTVGQKKKWDKKAKISGRGPQETEKGRRNAEAKRVTAESIRERAEKTRIGLVDRFQKKEDERTISEDLRASAEAMRKFAEEIRQSTMMSIQSQERMRESAEIMRASHIGRTEMIHQSMVRLHREATKHLHEIEKVSRSAREIFRRMEEMLRDASGQMKKGRL